MLAIGLALGASLAWGLGDFLGGLQVADAARAHGARDLAQAAGFAVVLVWVGASVDGFPAGLRRAFAAAAGVGGCVGLAPLPRDGGRGDGRHRADRRLVRGDPVRSRAWRPASARAAPDRRDRWSRSSVWRSPRASRPSAAAAVAAGVRARARRGVGFGFYFAFLDRAAAESVPFAVATAQGVSSLLAVGAAIAVGRVACGPERASCPCSSSSASATSARTSSSALATTRGYVSVVSVLASLYPVVTVALAAFVLHERVAPSAAARRRRRPRRSQRDHRGDGRSAIPALPDDVPDMAPGTTLALAKATCLGRAGELRRPARSGTPPEHALTDQPSDVEADVQDVAVLDDVGLALEPLRARGGPPRRASRRRRGRPSGSPRSG